MQIMPTQDYVLVEKIEPEQRTAGGLIIPNADKDEPMRAKVVRIGNINDVVFEEGDDVILTKYAGIPVSENGIKYLLVNSEDIIAWLEVE